MGIGLVVCVAMFVVSIFPAEPWVSATVWNDCLNFVDQLSRVSFSLSLGIASCSLSVSSIVCVVFLFPAVPGDFCFLVLEVLFSVLFPAISNGLAYSMEQ